MGARQAQYSRSLIATVACIYATCNPKISYVPVSFRMKDGPDWLYIDSRTGAATIIGEPRQESAKVSLIIELVGLRMQSEVNEMRMQIHHEREVSGGPNYVSLTKRVVRKVDTLPPQLKAILKDL